MKPARFEYHIPATVQEALAIAATFENSKFLAGGQTLMPMMNFRFMMPDHVIDLSKIAAIQEIRCASDILHIGAMARQRDIERHPEVARRAPLIPEAYSLVSHRQIRSRGTLGGSLCHLDPSSEQPCFLAAQGATLVVENQSGTRRIPIEEWSLMYMTPALEEGELLVGVECDLWPIRHGWSFTEYARRQGDYAIVGVAVLSCCDEQRRITRLSVALCGMGSAPVRLFEAERDALGQLADSTLVDRIAQSARTVQAMSDAHTTAEYRQHLAATLTKRALETAFSRMSV